MIGILLMSYGSPKSVDDIEAFFSHILKGRTPPAEQLTKITSQYQALETADLLGFYTERQAEGLQHLLQGTLHEELKVYAAFKHAPPYIEDIVKRCVEEGVTKLVTLPLVPLYSETGVGQYQKAVQACVDQLEHEVSVVHIENWYGHSELASAFAKRVKHALDWLPKKARKESSVIFTTHSKPGTVEKHQTYCDQFTALATQIAEQLEIGRWITAYRSARPNQEWLGPDVKEAIREEAEKGAKGIVVCDLLSIAENIETSQELGEECKSYAEQLGVTYVRSQFLNDAADFIFALGAIVQEQLEKYKGEDRVTPS